MHDLPSDADLEIGLLGPFEVTVDGNRLDLGSPRQQVVLAVLALEANRLVPIPRLMDAVYGTDPPPTSRVQVQICISALRRLFARHGHRDNVIATRSQGYALQVSDARVDLRRFTDLSALGRRSRDNGRLDEAVRSYRHALAQWRGPALDGLINPLVRAAADRLDEQRLNVLEECVGLELRLGRHRDLVDELTALVHQNPLRERLHGHLMLALYRSQRQAEALEVYRRARRLLVDELGIEPNTALQQLERDILAGHPRLDPSVPAGPPTGVPAELPTGGPTTPRRTPPAEPTTGTEAEPTNGTPGRPDAGGAGPPVAVPRLLPTDIADFTGRAEQAEAIERHLTDAAAGPGRLAVPVLVLSGMAGIGKTTLAVQVAHHLAGWYSDGQLFVDLRGETPRPVDPNRVLERFLRVLGMPGTRLPETLEERAEMYRHMLSGRRILVVLDSAGDEGQVLPLLPGTPSAAVLVTSRSRLAGLAGAGHVELGVLDPSHSVELLSRVAGPARMRAEPAGSARLAALCGHLPLALRVAGARLATRPQWTVGQLVERLGNETRRLDELRHGVLGFRASISLTYESLTEPARRLFRRLALLDFAHFAGWVAAALLDQPEPDAQDLLDDLADAHLVETTGNGRGVHSRYRFHDLIRTFARERLADEEPMTEHGPALRRALGALLFLVERAHSNTYGTEYPYRHSDAPRWPLPQRLVDALMSAPLDWMEQERASILAGVRQAATAGSADLAWDLATSAVILYEARAYLDDWHETHEVALDAARRAGDKEGQAHLAYSIGSLHLVQRRLTEARRFLDLAVALFQSTGNDNAEVLAIRNLAAVDRISGRLDDAALGYQRALKLFRRTGELVDSAYVLQGLAEVEVERGDPAEARRMLIEALELSRRGGSRRVEAQVLYRLGETCLRQDEPRAAVDAYRRALTAVEETGDRTGRAFTLGGLGIALLRTGELAESGATLHEALRAATTVGDRFCEAQVLLRLGEFHLSGDEPRQAAAHLGRALELFRDVNAPLFVSRALALLARAEEGPSAGA